MSSRRLYVSYIYIEEGLEINSDHLYLFILFITQIPNSATAGSARINATEREKSEEERDRRTEVEASYLNQSNSRAHRGKRTEWKRKK